MTHSHSGRVRVARSPIEGKGLFAVAAIRAGELIFDDDAQSPAPGGDGPASVVMTDAEFRAYTETVDHYSAVAIGNGRHRVSLRWSDVDYGNHSCDPNAWAADDGVTLFARRDIDPGEEITTDYALCTDNPDWEMECHCGAAACRGTVRGQDWQRADLQHAYEGHWPAFLAEKIDALRADR